MRERRASLPYRSDPTYFWSEDDPQPQGWARFGLRTQLLSGHQLVSNAQNNRARLLPFSPQRLPRVVTTNHPATLAIRGLEIAQQARRPGYGRRR